MVAIVGGAELGLGLASGLVLGARGQVGSSLQGRSNEGVTVNAVTGNLVLQRQDEYVAGQGPDIGIVRTYNSLGLLNSDENGDNWRLGFSRKVYGLTGGTGVNTAGSTVTRLGEDGAESIYTYDTTRAAYITTKGPGAYDLLTFSSGTNKWTWTDGSTQGKEIYDNANGGRLIQVLDADGNTQTIGYTGSLVTLITDANGEKTAIDYETGTGKTNNIAQVRTLNSAGTLVLIRVRYGYDSNNRLITATVDLSPADSLITDSKTYVTTYTYDDASGVSRRLASISQTDGSQLQFTYVQVGTDYRIQTVKDVRGADIRTTTYAYNTTTRITTVTDPVGQITEFTYDTSNQLLSIKTPAVNSVSVLTSFTYDANGNVVTVTDGRGNTVTYGYDTNGNRILERDAAGNTVTRTFGATNQLLEETTYSTPDMDGAGVALLPSGSQTTRYVYDGEQHLRFVVSPDGRVTEYRYNAVGQKNSEIEYAAGTFDPSVGAVGLWTQLFNDVSGLTTLPAGYMTLSGGVLNTTTVAAASDVYPGVRSTASYPFGAVISADITTGSASSGRYLVFGADNGGGTYQRHAAYFSGGNVYAVVSDAGGNQQILLGTAQNSTAYVVEVETLPDGRSTVYVHLKGAARSTGYSHTYQFSGWQNAFVYLESHGAPALPIATMSLDNLSVTLPSGWSQKFQTNADGLGVLPAQMSIVAGGLQIQNSTAATDSWPSVSGTRLLPVGTVFHSEITTGASSAGRYLLAGADNALGGAAYRRHAAYFDGGNLYANIIDNTGKSSVLLGTVANNTTYEVDLVTEPDGSSTLYVYEKGKNRSSGFIDRRTNIGWTSTKTFLETYVGPGVATATMLVSELSETPAYTEGALAAWANTQRSSASRIDTTYDVRGQVDKVTTFASVDAAGVGVADGTQSTSQYVYDQAGQLLQKIDARGVATTGVSTDFITSFTYDGLGRQLTTTDALGRLTTALYEDGLRKTTLTLANSQITATTYDQAGNPVSIVRSGVEGALGTTTYTYNKLNQLVAQTDPTGGKSYFIYDAVGRQVGQIDGTGALTEYVYNKNNQLGKTIHYATAATVTVANIADPTTLALGVQLAPLSANDRITYSLYDTAGRLAKTIDGVGAVVQYLYDGANRLTDTIQFSTVLADLTALTVETAPTDAKATVAAVAASDRRNRQFYSNDGLLLGTLDGEGYLIEHLYNAAGQRTQTIKYATQTVSGNWAAGTLTVLRPAVNALKDQSTYYLYNGKGQLVGTVDAEGYLNEFQYDLVGNKTADIRYATKVTYTPGNTLAATRPTVNTEDQKALYQYDALNQLIRIDSLPDGLVTTYAYDNVGNRIQTVKALGATEARTETVRYDSLGRVTQQLTAEGAVALAAYGASPTQSQIDTVWTQYGVKHTYDTAGRRTSSADQLGNKTLFYYDAAGRVTYTINALGEVTAAVYSVLGDITASRRYGTRLSTATLGTLTGGLVNATLTSAVTAITNAALDTAETFTAYDKRGMVTTRKDALGNDTILSYNAFGELKIRNTKVDSANTRYYESFQAYDRRGLGTNPRKDTTSTGSSTTTMEALILTYDAFGRVTRTVDARGKNWDSSYDRLGRTLTTTTPGTTAQVMTYDAFGRVLTRKDALLNTTIYSYDTASRKVTITSPEGIATSTIKNRHGETVSVTDGRGNITSYNYDANGQLKNIITPAGTTTQNYDPAGQQIETIDANGIKTAYTYDVAGRVLTRSVDPTGLNLTSKTFYDAKSQAIWQQDASGIWTQTQYDLKGQVTSVIVDPTTIPNASSTETAITPVANATGLNLRTDYTYDARGKTLTVTEGVGSAQPKVTQYSYDKLGRRTQEAVDPTGLNLLTQYAYDLNDNLIAKTDALTNVTRYVYSDKNQLIYSVDATGAVIKTDYDGEGRVTATTAYANAISLTSPTVLGTAITTTDITGRLPLNAAADQITRTVYNKDGQIKYRIDPTNAVTALTYDAAGNVIQTTRYFTAITVPGTVNATTIAAAIVTHANDQTERTVYDAANRATFNIDAANYVTQTVYDSLGQATKQIRYTNALAGTFSTNVAPQIVSTAPGSGSYVLTNATSDRTTRAIYDAAGRTRFNVDGEGYITERRYDALGRETKRIQYAAPYTVVDSDTVATLTTKVPATPNTTTEPVEQSIYDTAGRLIKTIDGENVTTLHVYDAAGRETDTTVAYGTADASTTHRVFDLAGRLTQETVGYGSADAATTRYTLDGVGNRRQIIDPRGIELAETDSAWAQALRVEKGYPQLLANLSAAQKTALLALYTTTQTFDANGHVTVVSDPFSKTIQTQYDAFGNAVKVTDQRGNSGYFYFDKNNRNTWQVDPENYATQTVYNAFGTVDKVTHYAATVTGTPAVGTLPTVTANATFDQTTVIEHDKRNLQTKITDAENNYETMAYDAFGNKWQYQNKLAGVYTYTFDRKGQVKSETTPSVTVTTVDTAGVVTTVAQALVTQYSYDARGNQTLIREAVGTAQQRDTVIGYDKANRETRRDLPAISVFNAATKTSSTQTPYTTTTYDKRGNVVEVRDAAGNRTLQYYDVLNRKIAGVDGAGTLSEYTYDDVGNLVKERTYTTRLAIASQVWTTRPVAVAGDTYREMNYVYDANNRRIQTITQAETYFNPLGLVMVANGNQTVTGTGYVTGSITTQSSYDATGNVVKTIDGRGFSTLYFYDKLGQQTLSVDPLGFVTQLEYDDGGHIIRQSRFAQHLPVPTTFTTNSLPIDIVNAVKALPAGVDQDRVIETDYDRAGRKKAERVLSVRYTTVSDTGVVAQLDQAVQTTYKYDAAGNVKTVIKADGSQTDYEYDVLSRAIREQDPTTSVYNGMSGSTVLTTSVRAKTEWQYDALGNSTLQTRYGLTTADNQITRSRYDADGNLIAEWDALGNRTDYDVDAGGRVLRQSKSATDIDAITHTYRTYFTYDALNRELNRQLITDEGTGTVVSGDITGSTYNAFGDIATRSINGLTQAEYRYDKLGHLFWTNADTGTPRVYVYDASGNAMIEISAKDNDPLSALTSPYQAQVLNPAAVQIKFSLFDARNQLTDTFQTPMDFTGLTGILDKQDTQSAYERILNQTTTGNWVNTGTGAINNGVQTTAPGNTNSISYVSWSQPSTEPVYAYGLDPTNTAQMGSAAVASPTQVVGSADSPVTATPATGASTTAQSATVTDVDYQAGTATVGQQTATTPGTITNNKTTTTNTNSYSAFSKTQSAYGTLGGLATENSQLVYVPAKTLTVYARPPSRSSATSADFVLVPRIDGYGPGAATVHIDFYGQLGRGIGIIKSIDDNNLLADKVYAYTQTPRSYDPLPKELTKVVVTISKNGIVIFNSAIDIDTSDPTNHTLSIGSYLSVFGTDSNVQSASISLTNGQSAQLTRVNYSTGGVEWYALGLGTGAEGFEYKLFNSATQNDSTLTGDALGGSLSTPGTRTLLKTVTTTTTYYVVTTPSTQNSTFQKIDITKTVDQSNYYRKLFYSLTEDSSAASNQIHRSTTRNAFGEVVAETDGLNQLTQYAYNELGKLIRKQDPAVSYTGEDGVVVNNFTPITQYYVDAVGNTVGQVDANNFATLQAVRNGQLTAQFNPSGVANSFDGVERSYYDMFGNLVAKTISGTGLATPLTTRYTYDKANRLTRTDYAGGNYDIYEYDALGNRIAHTNGLGDRETYKYDAEGRITRYRSFENRETKYNYTFLSTIGERGGYRKTTIDPLLNTQTDDVDTFGKIRAHTDLGGHTYTYTYNTAGWLTQQTNNVGQNIVYAYYNNGYLKEVTDKGINSYSLFQYDKDGNRTLESYAQASLITGVQGTIPYQVAKSTYDALNRVTSVQENGKFDIKYEYDKVGNRRRVKSVYTDLLTNTPQVQDFYYKYDAMNRFTTSMGKLVGGQIVLVDPTDPTKASGYQIAYNAANQRMTQTTIDAAGKSIKERYTYDNNGFLTNVYINPDSTNGSSVEALRAQRVNNAVGDRTGYSEFNASGIATSGHTYIYDKDHILKSDIDAYNTTRHTEYILTSDGRTSTVTSYDPAATTVTYTYEYLALWDSYQQSKITVSGIAAGVERDRWRNGVSDFIYDVNGHVQKVYDHEVQRTINYINNQNGQTLKRFEYTGNVLNNIGAAKPAVIRDFYYFNGYAIGDQGTDKVASRVDYAQTLRGAVLEGNGNKTYIQQKRSELMPALWQRWMNGEAVSQADWDTAYAGSSGPVSQFQHQDIGQRVIPVTSADFDQNFQPINEGFPAATSGTYTVKTGDTLQSIAASVWGDASLWYLIADANGLKGSETLTADMRLTLPNVVTNIHNTSSTHRVFDPGLTLGDTTPTLPSPPPPPHKGGGGCGGIAMILVIIVAVVVTVFTAGAALAVMAPAAAGVATGASLGATMMAGGMAALGGALGAAGLGVTMLAGAIGAAAGSIVSQGLGMAMGMQDSFSWGQVGVAAIGGAVGGGVAKIGGFSPGVLGAVQQGAISSIATQGISVAVGLQKKFSWTQVAASAVGAGVGNKVGGWIGGGDATQNFMRGFGSSMASGAANALISGERPNWGLIAANSFGQAAGNAVISKIVDVDRTNQAQAALEKNGIDVTDVSTRVVKRLIADGNNQTTIDQVLRDPSAHVALDAFDAGEDVALGRVSITVEGMEPPAEEEAFKGRFVGAMGHVKDAAVALDQFAEGNQELTSIAISMAQAAISGGPVKPMLMRMAKAAAGDAFDQAIDEVGNRIHESVKDVLISSGFDEGTADISGAAAGFGVTAAIGGAKNVLGSAKNVRKITENSGHVVSSNAETLLGIEHAGKSAKDSAIVIQREQAKNARAGMKKVGINRIDIPTENQPGMPSEKILDRGYMPHAEGDGWSIDMSGKAHDASMKSKTPPEKALQHLRNAGWDIEEN